MAYSIIFYDENRYVINVINDVLEPVIGDGEVTWHDGMLKGIRSNYVVVDYFPLTVEGDLLDEWILLEAKKKNKFERFETLRDIELSGKFKGTHGYYYPLDEKNKLCIHEERLRLMLDGTRESVLVRYELGIITLFREGFLALYDDYLAFKDYWDTHYMNRVSQIESAQSLEELDAIPWVTPNMVTGVVSLSGKANVYVKENGSTNLIIVGFPGRATLTVIGTNVAPDNSKPPSSVIGTK